MQRLWRDYSLSIVLATLFLVSLAAQTWTGWVEFVAEQQGHGQEPELLGPSGYVWRWGQATFENWQSEFLQLLAFVVLTSFLVHRGSHESRDGDDELRATLGRVEARLARIERLAVARGAGSEMRPGGDHGDGGDRAARVREHPDGLALTATGAAPEAQ